MVVLALAAVFVYATLRDRSRGPSPSSAADPECGETSSVREHIIDQTSTHK